MVVVTNREGRVFSRGSVEQPDCCFFGRFEQSVVSYSYVQTTLLTLFVQPSLYSVFSGGVIGNHRAEV